MGNDGMRSRILIAAILLACTGLLQHQPMVTSLPVINAPTTLQILHMGTNLEEQQPPAPTIHTMEATAYTWTGNRTATGTWPEEGRTIAVDPEVIPLGSELIINGRPGYIAEDTGGDIKGNRIDIYMNSRGQAVSWGRQQVEVEVIE